MTVIVESELPLKRLCRGKVRDVYEVDDDRVLLVATDRVSAFDVVMAEPIPHKGLVLTQLTAWWLRRLGGQVDHHLISAETTEILEEVPALASVSHLIGGRAMLCRRLAMLPIECVVRGYLAGSAWKEYAERGTLAGERLPAGLLRNGRLEPPLFSPATKVATGHDENLSVSRARMLIGPAKLTEVERLSRLLYDAASALSEKQGIIIADTKFEFGTGRDGSLVLGDEVLTPDSSRFWALSSYVPGRPQQSFDKQPLRDWLDEQRVAGRWTGGVPTPRLPPEVISATSSRYIEAFRRLTGSALPFPSVL